MKYWTIIVGFSLLYLALMFAGTTPEGHHTYGCYTDMECYLECVRVGDTNCE